MIQKTEAEKKSILGGPFGLVLQSFVGSGGSQVCLV